MVNLTSRAVTQSVAGVFLVATILMPVGSATALINTGTNDLAVHGYDVVAYFTEGRAISGKSEFEHSWEEARWLFSSAANKARFVANPERYAPQYGGHCAMCLAIDGEISDANPKAWTIIKGKLYLNYSMYQRNRWRSQSQSFVTLGDEEWTKVLAIEKKRTHSRGLYRVAILPFSSPMTGPGRRSERVAIPEITRLLHELVEESDAFTLSYSSYPPESNVEVASTDEIWTGGFGLRRTPKVERVHELGRELGVDAVFVYFFRNRGGWFGEDQYYWEGYLFDTRLNRVYHHEGDENHLRIPTERLLSEFIEGRKDIPRGAEPALAQSEGRNLIPRYTVAILPLARFVGVGAFWLADTEIPDLLHELVHESDSFTLSYSSYDPVSGGDNTPIDGIWTGDLIHKVPRAKRVYEIGRQLDVDGVLMYFYKSRAGGQHTEERYDWEGYFFDILSKRIYQQQGDEKNLRLPTERLLSEFIEGRSEIRPGPEQGLAQ